MKMEKGRKLISKLILFLGILLSLTLVLMPGMSFKVYAATDTYTNLIPIENDPNFDKIVSFNGYKWFIIKDDSASATEGTVTLLAADNSFGFSVFSENGSSDYKSSKVRSVLDALTVEGGSFAGVKDAIADTDLEDVGVTGAKLYLLSISEADQPNIRCMYFGDAMIGAWWLRSHGLWSSKETPQAAYVGGLHSYVADLGADVANNYGVRPALRLDLSAVIFSSDTNTFSLRSTYQTATVTKAPEAKSLTYNGSAQELVTAGEAEGGTMQYAIGADAITAPTTGWSATIPQATVARTYYVWYKVVGNENFEGINPACITVIIAEQQTNIDKSQKSTTISEVEAGKKSIKVTWKKQTAKGIAGYEIQYSTNKKFKKDVKTVTIKKAKTTSVKIKKLKSNKKYYVRIRTYKKSGSKMIYSSWSKSKRVKVK